MACGKVNTANPKWLTSPYRVRALRKPLIQMIFQNLSTQIHEVSLVEQRGSRECTKNAFADKPLAAKRSPGIHAGRGLKHLGLQAHAAGADDRPAFMPGAD